MVIQEDSLTFTFSENVDASKYDQWSHYRNQFKDKCSKDNKAVDFIAFEEKESTLWLCEIKDFRMGTRSRDKLPLEKEIAQKVRDTLAGIVSAKFRANDPDEKKFAENSLKCKNIRVILHIEQSSEMRQIYDLKDLRDKLRKLLRAVDPHVDVKTTTQSNQNNVPWTIS
jgi:cysteine--tRNA ligase